MAAVKSARVRKWLENEEQVYSLLFSAIAASLVLWPLFNSICCILLFAYWLLFSKKRFLSKDRRTWWVILFSMLFFVVVAGVFYSDNFGEALFKVQLKIPLLLFPLVMGTADIISPGVFSRTIRTLNWACCLGCLICIGNGILVFVRTGSKEQLQGYNMIILDHMTPAVMGLCCLLSILFIFTGFSGVTWKSLPRPRAVREIFIAAILIFFLFLLGNRSILFCLAALVLFYCIKRVTAWQYRVLLVTGLVLAFVIAVRLNPFFRYQWDDLVDFSQANSIQLDQDQSLGRGWGGKAIRITIWQCSWDVIKEHWLLGVGTGDVQDNLQAAYEKRKFYFASRYNRYNAHNQYIEETIAHGITGLLVFLSCLIWPLFAFTRKARHNAYVFFLLSFALVCLTESLLELNKGIIWYSFFNSIFIFKNLNHRGIHGIIQ